MILGAQLYTLREFTKTEEDIRKTFKKVADIGYTTIQASAIGPVDPHIVKDISDENGLKIIITHTKPERLFNEIDDVIKEHDIYDCKYIGLGSMPKSYRTVEGVGQFIKDITPVIEKISASGKKFMYHHHSFEFYKMPDGRTIFQTLLDAFPADKLGIIFDTYWMQNGGNDVCEMIEKLNGRLECVHLKDMYNPTIENDHTFSAIGDGVMNFPKIIDTFKKNGVSYMFVEQDTCPCDPFECLKRSFDYVNTLDY